MKSSRRRKGGPKDWGKDRDVPSPGLLDLRVPGTRPGSRTPVDGGSRFSSYLHLCRGSRTGPVSSSRRLGSVRNPWNNPQPPVGSPVTDSRTTDRPVGPEGVGTFDTKWYLRWVRQRRFQDSDLPDPPNAPPGSQVVTPWTVPRTPVLGRPGPQPDCHVEASIGVGDGWTRLVSLPGPSTRTREPSDPCRITGNRVRWGKGCVATTVVCGTTHDRPRSRPSEGVYQGVRQGGHP